MFTNEECKDAHVLAGTAWLFSDADLDGELDYLFIDEAGQVSLADALAMSTCAKNVVLVGDPQQLGQVLQGSHPGGSRRLGARAPARRRADGPARPRALPRAHVPAAPGRVRLHLGGVLRGPAAARPGHLDSHDAVRHRAALDSGRARRHAARNRPKKPRQCAKRSNGSSAGVAPAEIKVVAPYNAQVEAAALASCPAGVEVGTVDKFQGQEAKVVLYSMTSSSGEDIPRGLDVPALAKPLQRRDLTRTVPRLPRLFAATP